MVSTFGLILIPIHLFSMYIALRYSYISFLIATYCLIFLLGVPSVLNISDYFFYPTYMFFLPLGLFYLFKGDLFFKKENKSIKSSLDHFTLIIIFIITFLPILGGYFDFSVFIDTFMKLIYYYSFAITTFLYYLRNKKNKLITYVSLFPYLAIFTYFFQLIGLRHPLGDTSYLRKNFLIFDNINIPSLFSSHHNAGGVFVILNFILYLSIINFKPKIYNNFFRKSFYFIKKYYSYLIIILAGLIQRSFLLFVVLSISFFISKKILKKLFSREYKYFNYIFSIIIGWLIVFFLVFVFIDPSNLLKFAMWYESFKMFLSQSFNTIIFGMGSKFPCELQNNYFSFNPLSLNFLDLDNWDINLNQFECFPIHNIYIEFTLSYGIIAFIFIIWFLKKNYSNGQQINKNIDYVNLSNFMYAILFNYIFHNGLWGPWIYALLMLIILRGIYNKNAKTVKDKDCKV